MIFEMTRSSTADETRPTSDQSDERWESKLSGRRDFLGTVGAIAATGLLAGCSDGGDGGNEENPETVDEWLSDTGNYDQVVDRTDASTVTVDVGAQGNSGQNAYAPAAIEITPGSTVVWEWINGHHNVVATDGTVDSGSPEENATFEHTFDEPGTTFYYCDPHRSLDMKGAVVVTGGDDSANVGSSAGNTENQ